MATHTSTREQFLGQIEVYLDGANMLPTQFGLAVMKDPNFVFDLRDGRSVTLATMDKVMAWMAEHPASNEVI